MRLSTLIAALNQRELRVPAGRAGDGDPEISGVHYDSRTVTAGGLFVAIRGLATDGHRFVKDALARGAAALICETPMDIDGVMVVVDDSRQALAETAAAFYGRPSEDLTIIAVTGTNGKTTVTYLIENILEARGLNTGVIGTVNYRYGGRAYDHPGTTPESLDLQRILAEMRSAGVSHVVMEASSHALDLQRVHACRLRLGVYTNITQDHLDYHRDMDAYQDAKALLFERYLPAGPADGPVQAVLNVDDAFGRDLQARLPHVKLCCSAQGPDQGRAGAVSAEAPESAEAPASAEAQVSADIRAEVTHADAEGFKGTIITPAGRVDLNSPLVGAYNLENILSAAGAAVALDIAPTAIAAGLAKTRRVPGRLEAVPNVCGRQVYVDYAHTPDALENVLKALRPLTQGRIFCVFGCGGDRDATKRPLMGEIAGRRSDVSVITSDNPRSEDPMAIVAQIVPGTRKVQPTALTAADLDANDALKGYLVEVDRRQAIELAIRGARSGDIVLIAGKGHETYQIIGDRVLDFDDSKAARRVLAALETEA